MDLREVPDGAFVRHPWELARLRLLRGVLEEGGLHDRVHEILDVGSGDAWLAQELRGSMRGARLTCWDTGYPDDRESGGVRWVRERPTGRFSLVLALDVLEHVDEDAALLRALVLENLDPGGHLLVAVPAWRALFSSHDRALAHRRRYDPGDALALLRGAGLEAVVAGGAFHLLLPLRGLAVAGERLWGAAPRRPELRWRHGRLSAALAGALLAGEGAVSRLAARRGLGLPGLSWWALCRRAPTSWR